MISTLFHQYKTIRKNTVLIGSGVVSIGIFLGSIINYLNQLFLGRFLSVEDFGTFNALLSLTTLLTVPSMAIMVSLIKVVTKLKNEEKFNVLTALYWDVVKYSALFGVFLFLLVVLFTTKIGNYLNIENYTLIIIFGAYLGVSFITTAPKAYLQGLLRFKAFSGYSIASPLLRLIFSILVVLMGYSVGGLYVAMIIVQVGAFLMAYFLLKKNFRTYEQKKLNHYYKQILTFSISVVLIRVALAVYTSIDVVLVKHFFTAEIAGIYAGVVNVGKVILFGTGILGTVMFPVIANDYARKGPYINRFLVFTLVQCFIIFLGVVVFYLFPEFITVKMFGKAYLPGTIYLPRYTLFVGMFSLLSFVTQFFLAIEKAQIYVVLLLGALIQYLLINFYHQNLSQVININIGVLSTLLIICFIYLLKVVYNHER